MSYDPNNLVVRRPRHAASADPRNRIWLEEPSGGLQRDVQLVDFSRNGAKMEIPAPLTPDAHVHLHVEDGQTLAVCLPGWLRWQRRVTEGRWLVGCLFETEVPYEVIGELFLRGILEMDAGK